ncbi:Hypothetical predicted protein [Cloeon dipterum]|uniref:Uncharacterized protein n=1 Tax=Cloeon dipterum TaxID=197152 RepID=A0A8S1CXE1_9INSE|nr:Hypothetical predicted protein [Cloeon dipterum]
MSVKGRILAGISWNRNFHEELFELDLKDSAIFINETRNIEEISRKFFLFNSTFPFYIPPEFHAMDARAMRETCPNGQYWAIASLFLLYNNPHTLFAWEEFGCQDSSSNFEEKCRPSISTQMMKEVFPKLIPQCESAAHFLLDFSVLVQLPFKPVLLHQWLVAVYYEALRCETEMIKFYFFEFPLKDLISVEALFQALYSLQDWLEKGFTWFKKRVNGKMKLGHEDVNELNEVIKKITKFFKLCDILTKIKLKENYSGLISSNRNFVYNFVWWKMPEEERDFFGYSLIPSGKQDIEDYFPFPAEDNSIENLLERISRNLFLDENEMQSLIGNMELKERARKYDHLKKVAKLLRIQEKDRGILGDIFFAMAIHDMKLAWLELLVTTVKMTKKEMNLETKNDLEEETVKTLGPEPLDYQSKLSTGKTLRYSEFTEPLNLIDISRELRQSIREPNPQEVSEDPLKWMAKNFQERIQKLVIETISAQYKLFEKEKDVGRDWQMGYLLSCFVASFLDLKENPKVENKLKHWYMQFIHELIAEYEASRFQELNDVAVTDGIDGCSALFVLYHMKEPALLLSYFKTIENAFLAEMEGGDDVLLHFKNYHMFGVLYEVLEFSGAKTDLSSEPSIPWMWQLLDFFRKMEKL